MDYGREIDNRIVSQRAIKTAIDRQRGCCIQDRVAVGIGACDRFGREIASGPRLVLDYNLLAPDPGQRLTQQPRREIGGAAWGKRYDQPYEAAGSRLRPRDTTEARTRER